MTSKPLEPNEFVIMQDDKGRFVLAPHTLLVEMMEAAKRRGENRLYLVLKETGK